MKGNNHISQEFLETIERYYNNSMSTEERVVFEDKLQEDTTFKNQVEDIKSLLFGIEEQAMREKMEAFHKNLPMKMDTKAPNSKVRFLNFRNIAAAVLIIIASTIFWLFNESSNDRLYRSYFEPDPGLPTTMGNSDNFAFFDAMVNYKQGDYKKAISKWEKLERIAPDNDTITYFLGMANLADDSAEKAIEYLNKTTHYTKSVFLEDAYYYLGLAYLKIDNVEAAKQAFSKSSFKKSQEILKALN